MEKKISFSDLCHFTPKQLEATAVADAHDYTLFGGAAGPGKSFWLRWYPLRVLLRWGKEFNLRGIRGALFSEDYPTLKDRQMSKMEVEFPRWLGEIRDSKTHGMGFHVFPKFGGHVLALRNLDDPSKYLSSEFALIAVEELTKNLEDKFHQLRSRMRWTGIPHPKFIAATNPGEAGHLWVKQRWIERKFPIEEQGIAHQFAYVPALPSDNPHLAASYLETLASLPEKKRKAYLEGNWDVFEGQYFSEWDVNKHVVVPFAIPASWKRYRAYDYGYENPACCKWYAVDYDGRVWVYREKYFPKGHKTEAGAQAEEIARLSEGETYEYSVADPSIFSPAGIVDRFGGQTIAETFHRRGIMFLPASNRRIDGWSLLHQHLSWVGASIPLILYFKTCVDSIRTIPSLVHSERTPEDLDSDGEDHCADVDRYFLMSFHERQPQKPLTQVEKKLELFKRHDEFNPTTSNTHYYGEP